MSHIPPPGGPPYYGHGYPPQYPPPHYPPPGSYSYVPTPVMMPVYPPQPVPTPAPQPAEPQPTYVTNYIYQQPTPTPTVTHEVVRYVEDPIDWVSATPLTAGTFTHRAFVAGKEGWDSSPLWIIRAHHSGEFVPGKLAVKHRSAYIPHGGKEVPVHNFEILCAPANAVRWLPASNGQVPVGAIPAGNTHTAETLYIARAKHLRSLTPGKVHPSHGCAYISFGGNEIPFKNYEVLCKFVG